MNAAEKKVLFIAVLLFSLGVLVRILPWEVPVIEQQPDPGVTEYVYHNTDKVTKKKEKKAEKPKKQKAPKKEKKAKKVKLPLHINKAGINELCALKGVGPKLAEKIIEVRTQNGPFNTPKDLQKVPGIGKKKLEGLLQDVIFD